MKTEALRDIISSILRTQNGFQLLSKYYPSYAKRKQNKSLKDFTSREVVILYNRFLVILSKEIHNDEENGPWKNWYNTEVIK